MRDVKSRTYFEQMVGRGVRTMLDTDFAPDGCVLDADNHIWVADALHGRACRVAPGGAIVEEVPAPERFSVRRYLLGSWFPTPTLT